MATERKRWFKTPDDVAFEPWSNDVAATYLRLRAYMNTRWARDGKSREEAASVALSSAVAMALTGSGSLTRARRLLNELAEHEGLVIVERGTVTMVEWRKCSEFQGYASEPGEPSESDTNSNTPPPTPRRSQDLEEEESVAAAAAPAAAAASDCPAEPAAPDRPRKPRPQPPAWSLDLARLLHDLAADAPGGRRASPSALEESARHIDRLSREATELLGTDPAPRIEAAIRWAFEPAQLESKFTPIVRCGKSLREKWTRLTLAAQRAQEEQRDPMQGIIDMMNGASARKRVKQ